MSKNSIYNFLKGTTADWLEEKVMRTLKDHSVFNYKHLENIRFNKIIQGKRSFLYDDGKNEYYMFAYKNSYATVHWGRLPVFHITKCRTREVYSSFVFASSMPVKIYCTDHRMTLGDKRLKFCRNCNRELNYFSFGTSNKSWQSVVLELADKRSKNHEYGKKNIRTDGYTSDWQQVSYAKRALDDFTCQSCNIRLEDDDAFYLEVHHLDRDRTNNQSSNLKTLCVECHSKVDESHHRNFSHGRNRIKVQSFINRFR